MVEARITIGEIPERGRSRGQVGLDETSSHPRRTADTNACPAGLVGWAGGLGQGDPPAQGAARCHRRPFQTRAEARQAIVDFIAVFANRQRRHSSLGYRSPIAFEKQKNESMNGRHCRVRCFEVSPRYQQAGMGSGNPRGGRRSILVAARPRCVLRADAMCFCGAGINCYGHQVNAFDHTRENPDSSLVPAGVRGSLPREQTRPSGRRSGHRPCLGGDSGARMTRIGC